MGRLKYIKILHMEIARLDRLEQEGKLSVEQEKEFQTLQEKATEYTKIRGLKYS